jgi:hypothetical protein
MSSALSLFGAVGAGTALSFGRFDAVPVVCAAARWLSTRLTVAPDIAQIIRIAAKQTTTIGTAIAKGRPLLMGASLCWCLNVHLQSSFPPDRMARPNRLPYQLAREISELESIGRRNA